MKCYIDKRNKSNYSQEGCYLPTYEQTKHAPSISIDLGTTFHVLLCKNTIKSL